MYRSVRQVSTSKYLAGYRPAVFGRRSIPSLPLRCDFHAQQSLKMNEPAAKLKSIDHIVLTVKDISTTQEFYTSILGMKAESFTSASDPSTKRHALSFGQQKINLHQLGAEFEPKAKSVCPGSADLCFVAETDVEEVLKGLKQRGVDVLEGGKVVSRTGAVGKLASVYFRDPDGNLVEVSNYV